MGASPPCQLQSCPIRLYHTYTRQNPLSTKVARSHFTLTKCERAMTSSPSHGRLNSPHPNLIFWLLWQIPRLVGMAAASVHDFTVKVWILVYLFFVFQVVGMMIWLSNCCGVRLDFLSLMVVESFGIGSLMGSNLYRVSCMVPFG